MCKDVFQESIFAFPNSQEKAVVTLKTTLILRLWKFDMMTDL